ncbi:MAG: YihA family ribosome biogenesis GTP-binding protein [Spirochaetales bacterium]|nr:YihA family ribosome biogenesis GTP-binding protein [Spirochaetales bacterium]
MINFRNTRFLKSCPSNRNLPLDDAAEIAFSGRSNVGKSSVLNSLTNQKKLAKSSGVPGKTREINLFTVNEKCRLVDLPGYGFAKVSKKEQERWGQEMTRYIAERTNLKGVIIIMDMRHPLTELDRAMISLVRDSGKAFAFLLNKSDKLGTNDRVKTIKKVEKELIAMNLPAIIIPYSAEKKNGVDELAKLLSGWIEG